MIHLLHNSASTRLALQAQTAAIDPIAQVRSGLGWLALLEVLVGKERARDIILQGLATK